MKTALYIENNRTQVILTPENNYEKEVLKQINANQVETTIKIGNFKDCKGGWTRYYPCSGGLYGDNDEIDSLMLILTEKEVNSNGNNG